MYHLAAAMVWIKDWINLENKRVLSIEGHDLQRRWHSFLWDGKCKQHVYFQRHMIRDSLIRTWNKIKKNHDTKIPNWLSTMEAKSTQTQWIWGKRGIIKTY
uniref:Uncharacterized protein n=1 Tax=Micrurus surinamensis TaxID=129470 RepID=A0A2D4PHJ0_MICSU